MRVIVFAFSLLLILGMPLAADSQIRTIDLDYNSTNCTNDKMNFSTKDQIKGNPVRVLLEVKQDYAGYWDTIHSEWTDDITGTISYTPAENGTYLFSFSRPGYYPIDMEFIINDCYECLVDADCADDQMCVSRTCINLTGECGYPLNHSWVEYECCENIDCADMETCENAECVPLECGYCEYPQNHACIAHECCKNADCAAGQECDTTLHVCVQADEPEGCQSNSECADNEKCSNGNCITIMGECGYAQNHQWHPYECCDDDQCASGWCLDDNTCSSTPRPPTNGNGGGDEFVCVSALITLPMLLGLLSFKD